jgi:hypothetical protein
VIEALYRWWYGRRLRRFSLPHLQIALADRLVERNGTTFAHEHFALRLRMGFTMARPLLTYLVVDYNGRSSFLHVDFRRPLSVLVDQIEVHCFSFFRRESDASDRQRAQDQIFNAGPVRGQKR